MTATGVYLHPSVPSAHRGRQKWLFAVTARFLQAAAAALRRILPSATSEGHALTIPMPGHAPANDDVAAAMCKVRCS